VNSTKEERSELVERATKALMSEVNSFLQSSPRSKGSDVFDDRPTYPLPSVLKMFRSDSVAWGGAKTRVDKILENGWYIRDKKTGERDEKAKELLKGKRFDPWLRETATHYVLFLNSFGELVYTPKGNVKELHTIDPTQMEIIADEHGDLQYYAQSIGGVSGFGSSENKQIVTWQPEEIIHTKDVSIDLSNWAEISSRTIWEAVAIKFHVKKFLAWLFETNQFRGIYNIKAADELQIKRSISFLKESEKNIKKPVIFEGEFGYTLMRELKDLTVLNDILYKMDEEILNFIQVPPIYAGLPDNSNRSNSDAQERAFNTTIRNDQKILKESADELLKRMKLFNKEFVFEPVSVKVTKELVEVAQLMKSISVKGEVIADWMREQGINLPPGDIFDAQLETNNLMTQDQAPSRRGKGVDQANEKIGTGEESTTREDQLVSRAEEKYNKKLWTYDLVTQE